MRNILGPFDPVLSVNFVKALKALPERGFECALVHDRRMIKAAYKCLERHGLRIKLDA